VNNPLWPGLRRYAETGFIQVTIPYLGICCKTPLIGRSIAGFRSVCTHKREQWLSGQDRAETITVNKV
jgi:hypothetical protein